MSMGFFKLINEIETEIKAEYLPGAIKWADETFDNAWSKAIDRFDLALAEAILAENWTQAATEGQAYKNSVLNLLRKYKESKGKSELDSFLEVIKR